MALPECKQEYIKKINLKIESKDDDDGNDETPPVESLPGYSNSSHSDELDVKIQYMKKKNPYYLI